MKVTVISGSSRTDPQSRKVAAWMVQQLKALGTADEVDEISLMGSPIPTWDESMWEEGSELQSLWGPYGARLSSSDAFVFVVPEWNGMLPPDIINFFHFCGNRELGYKPAMLVGVSDTLGGTYPVAMLRMTVGKNTKVVVLPDHVIVRRSKEVLNGPEPADEEEVKLRQRIDFSLGVLTAAGSAFTQMRASGACNDRERGCRNGM